MATAPSPPERHNGMVHRPRACTFYRCCVSRPTSHCFSAILFIFESRRPKIPHIVNTCFPFLIFFLRYLDTLSGTRSVYTIPLLKRLPLYYHPPINECFAFSISILIFLASRLVASRSSLIFSRITESQHPLMVQDAPPFEQLSLTCTIFQPTGATGRTPKTSRQ